MAACLDSAPARPAIPPSNRRQIPPPVADAHSRLATLTAAARDDIALLEFPRHPFPFKSDPAVLDVAIIGAGQTGKCIAFGLQRYGIKNIKIFDQRSQGHQGPWRTYARNHSLRTHKDHTGGLEWGIPSLHFVRWCEAKFGPGYYESMPKVPRAIWADYLDWFTETTALPISYETVVTDIRWNAPLRHFEIVTPGGIFPARFVVVATGIESAGRERVPPPVSDSLPRTAYTHTMNAIDIRQLKNRNVVVIGGGAAAFDAANVALEVGATSVDLMIRRSALPAAHRVCWGSRWIGYHRHYIELPDDAKWAYSSADLELGVPPPRDTYFEATSNPRFRMFTDAGIDSVAYRDGRIVGSYGGVEFTHDFMICGTGSRNCITEQLELQSIAGSIKLWKDAYEPPPGSAVSELELSPYLGAALQFTPKQAGDEFVERVYYLCSGVAHLSGFRCNLSALPFISQRVCHDISRHIFLDHKEEVKEAFDSYALWE